ncbi:MAG: hypothetical protein HDR03_13970 [Lachnospiraceae bacterium]|nr:hypothetical protein [Lachnospiraceae bacterium]
MERERSRINKVAIICHTIIAVVLLASYALEVVKGARTIGYYVVFAALAAVPVIMEWVLYKRNTADTKIQHVLGFGYSIFYIFTIFTTTNVTAFTFAFPLYVVITLYSDLKYCIAISSGGFLVNLIFTIYQAVTVGIAMEDTATYEIRNILMLLVAIFLCMVTNALEKINKMKMEDLSQEKENVSKLLNHVMSISGDMSEGIVEVSKQMSELGEAVSETRNAMQEVSSGTNETADAIQKQLSQTEEIQRYIEQVEAVSKSIGESMEQTKSDIVNGKDSLDTLLAQAKSSEQAGNEVVTDISALEEYMKNMQSIIELITNVASQTSLLALNASIEAARAGEAGKGFAVVAAEISNLANQTQSATVNITDVIHNVTDKLAIAVSAVEQLTNNNAKQNEVAVTVVDSFEKITGSTQSVDEQSRMLDEVVGSLADANAGIIEGIQTISAVMEEVTAHSNETYSISDKNTGIVNQVAELVDNLNAQAQSLNNTQ